MIKGREVELLSQGQLNILVVEAEAELAFRGCHSLMEGFSVVGRYEALQVVDKVHLVGVEVSEFRLLKHFCKKLSYLKFLVIEANVGDAND